MSTTRQTRLEPETYSEGAVAVTAAAGVLMVLIGTMHAIQGLVALANDDFYVIGQEYVFEFDVTTWGWIHLIGGVIVLLGGIALFQGSVWARTLAVVLASISILLNFMWLPYYPLWSLVVIAFDLFVIWAVTAHGRDIAQT
jgi:hypothetical protein